MAEGLAREGIATIRVDKRGMFGSAGAGNPNDVSIETYASDYRAWIGGIPNSSEFLIHGKAPTRWA